ncbi:copper resistance protein [Ralstonia pseudosolanacearum]|uniref:copper resistance protein n=1 Tax=Ralstonia pseudosolanacearum TaxID=1310165 RepID=UPI003AAF0A79
MRTFLRRLWMTGFLVVAFLTVQLAAAAYACAGSLYAVSATDEMAGMTESCPEMAAMPQKDGDKHDGLCLEHCKLNAKSADHFSPQSPVFLTVLVGVIEPTPVSTTDVAASLREDAVARAPPPPHAILHCCYRT